MVDRPGRVKAGPVQSRACSSPPGVELSGSLGLAALLGYQGRSQGVETPGARGEDSVKKAIALHSAMGYAG